MDEFGSPLSGGIRAVRRNISSSFLGAQRSQTDTISNDLIQEQSLKLTTVSSQLQNISRQIASLDFNLKAVRENLALSDQLERQRAAANQKRERQLAEQGLREGKESALEQKIQSSLTQPLRVIGARTQGILSRLTQFLFTLAGGWLTITGIDLLQSMAEGNVDKINRLKTKFLTGLTVLLGSLTAIQLGMKKSLAILGFFAGNVARVAFGGVLRASFAALRLLFGGLVKRAGKLGGLGGVGQTVRGVIDFIIGQVILSLGGKVLRFILKRIPFFKNVKIPETAGSGSSAKNKRNRKNKTNNKGNANSGRKSKGSGTPKTNFNKTKNPLDDFISTTVRRTKDTVRKVKEFVTGVPTETVAAKVNPNTFKGGGVLGLGRKFFNRGKAFVGEGLKKSKGFIDDGIKTIASSKLLTKLGLKTGGKGALKSVAKKLPLIGAVAGLAFGIERALGGDNLGAALEIISGILGATGVGGGASLGIDAFLIGRDVTTNAKSDNNVEGVTADSNNIEAVKNGNLDAANKISDFSEDKPQVIDLSQNNTTNSGAAGGGAGTEEESNTIPNITFNNNNSHVLAATVNYGF